MSLKLPSSRSALLSLSHFGLLLLIVSSVAAQLTTCVNQGYDITTITGADLYYTAQTVALNGGSFTYAIRPCGIVANTSFCTDLTIRAGEFCQGAITISAINLTAVRTPPLRGAIWAQVQVNGQRGVAQFLQDGMDTCALARSASHALWYSTAVSPSTNSCLLHLLQLFVSVYSFLGAYCDSLQADRQGLIEYVCNATATTPFISSITEVVACQ